jgi:phage protein D
MTSIVLTLLVDNSPAPTSVQGVLQEITVETCVDSAGSFRLRLGLAPGDDGGWPLLDQSLFPPGASVRIGIAVDRPNPAFLLVGYVAAQSVVFGDGQVAPSVEISGVDATALMNLEEKTIAWPNMADSVIATRIFGANQLLPQVTTTSPVLSDPEGTTVQRGTDIRFLRRLAHRNGFEVYVLPEPNSGTESGYFGPLPTSGAPAATLAVHAGDSTSVTDLKIAHDMLRPTEVVADGVDARHTTQNSDVSAASRTVGRTSTIGQLPRLPKLRLTGTGLTSATDLQRAAQAAVDRSSYSLVATGQVSATVGPLVPGTVVSLAGAGDPYSGPWVLRRVKHVIAPGTYTQHFTAARNGVGNTRTLPAAGM